MTPGIESPGSLAQTVRGLAGATQAPTTGSLTVVSGTAQQDATGYPSDVYVNVTGGTSGTVAVAIGATSTPATTIISGVAATANTFVHFRLPAGFYFKVTAGGSAAVGTATQVVGG